MLRLSLCLLLAVSTGAQVESPDPKFFAHRLESFYQHARTLKAIFFERYSDGSGGVFSESGIVYFSRPGRMRWDYESPEKKLFLVDGQNVWFYVPANHTASRAKVKQSSDWRTPLALLAGKADLDKLCPKLELLNPSGGSGDQNLLFPADSLLRCIPRDESATEPVDLEVSPEGELMRVVIREPGNAQTEFRFGNWEKDVSIPESDFHFVPPSGVSIVDEESLSGEMH